MRMQPSSIHSSSFLPSASGGVFLPAIRSRYMYIFIYIYVCNAYTRGANHPLSLSLSVWPLIARLHMPASIDQGINVRIVAGML